MNALKFDHKTRVFKFNAIINANEFHREAKMEKKAENSILFLNDVSLDEYAKRIEQPDIHTTYTDDEQIDMTNIPFDDLKMIAVSPQ